MFDTKCNNSSSFASTRNTELFNLSKVSMLPGQLVRPVSKVSSIFSNAIESKSKNFCERDTPNTSEGSQSSEHNKEDDYALCKTPEQKTINFDSKKLCTAPRLLSEYTKEELLKISTPKQRKMEFDPKEDCKAPLFKGLKFKKTEEQLINFGNNKRYFAICKTPEQKTINFDSKKLCTAPRLLSEYTKEELLKISTPKQRKMEFDPKEDCKAPLFKGLKFKTTEEQCNINNRIEVAIEAVENISLYKTTIHTK